MRRVYGRNSWNGEEPLRFQRGVAAPNNPVVLKMCAKFSVSSEQHHLAAILSWK
ncbi:hypothetical protein [Paenibacillus elgii]|uniref:hypothetical protein n=1 Tax=Paenibacillus elgii TaxID=189691 RepID=UPI0020421DC7|nr:hypothetical protein [Paenibacillus elgii]MCM3267192.1 hypothetical protein [Paenibacillus elgii]